MVDLVLEESEDVDYGNKKYVFGIYLLDDFNLLCRFKKKGKKNCWDGVIDEVDIVIGFFFFCNEL